MATLAIHILRLMGQLGLLGPDAPVRHSAKRRRIKTVIQELVYRAGRLIDSGRQLILGLGANDRSASARATPARRLASGMCEHRSRVQVIGDALYRGQDRTLRIGESRDAWAGCLVPMAAMHFINDARGSVPERLLQAFRPAGIAHVFGLFRAFVNRSGAALVAAIRLQSRVGILGLLGILGWPASAAHAHRRPPSSPETPPLGVPGGSATGVA